MKRMRSLAVSFSALVLLSGCTTLGNILEETAEIGTAVLTGYSGHLQEKNDQYRRSTTDIPTSSDGTNNEPVKSKWDDDELTPCEKFVQKYPNATACPA